MRRQGLPREGTSPGADPAPLLHPWTPKEAKSWGRWGVVLAVQPGASPSPSLGHSLLSDPKPSDLSLPASTDPVGRPPGLWAEGSGRVAVEVGVGWGGGGGMDCLEIG